MSDELAMNRRWWVGLVCALLVACGSEAPTIDQPLLTTGNTASTAGQPPLGCPVGLVACNGACLDVTGDARNCGSCGNACQPGQSCSAGSCVCLPGHAACAEGCVDTSVSATNCGGCGNACAPAEVCSAGVCSAGCGAGLTQCGQDCVDTSSSASHCMACGNVCPAGRECVAGLCSCTAGTSMCNGQCVTLATDPMNCGTCGNACESGVCEAGSCSSVVTATGGGTLTTGSGAGGATGAGTLTSTATNTTGGAGSGGAGGNTDTTTTGSGGATSGTTSSVTVTTTNTSTTGGTGECTGPMDPPEDMQQTIDLTWTEMTGGFQGRTGARPTSASVTNFRNLILDQLFAASGSLKFCVRWESNATVSATLRDQIEQALVRGVNEWFSKLEGYDCFPYGEIPVEVTGWATADRNLLDWDDDSVRIDVGDFREGAPQCREDCGRFFHQQAGFSYPNCPGGMAGHYDMSLWLTQGMSGGAGGDWGQRVGSEYFVNSVTQEHQHIWLHEFGHGLGFPDYYNWDEWAPGVASPNSVMVAGRASLVTEWDTWMIRRLWTELKSRLD